MSPRLAEHERMMREPRAPKAPEGWTALDLEVEGASAFTVELHGRARKAQDAARAAAEAVVRAERDDQARRARAIAEGKSDPGKGPAIAKAEAAAAEAAERARILGAPWPNPTGSLRRPSRSAPAHGRRKRARR